MRKIKCVFCDSAEVELFSLYGQTLLGSQYYCRNCRSIFEVVRFDEADLDDADLEKADLKEAYLKEVDLESDEKEMKEEDEI